ncbi:MAG: hypothetical protein ACK55Q_22845 [Dolichospermum sp.]
MIVHSKPKGRVKEKIITGEAKRTKKAALLKKTDSVWEHIATTKNPDYESGLKPLSFESCLIHNKGNRIVSVRTTPKYLTRLAEFGTDSEGFPYIKQEIETNDLKAGNHRKIKAVDKWCLYWQPLYESKNVTLFFFTFTRANKARMTIGDLMRILKMNLKRNNIELLDYLWIQEISDRLHFHYHLTIAIPRISFSRIPKYLKMDSYWGQRTQVNTVQKNIRHYLSKYFGKSSWRIDQGFRAYGVMRNPKKFVK